MAVIVVEIVGSRETHISVDAPTKEVRFTASGSFDDELIRAAIEAELPPFLLITSAFFGTIKIVLQSYTFKQRDEGNWHWDGSAIYGKRVPRQTGDIIMSFDGCGGTAHANISKETMGSFGRVVLAAAPVQSAPTLIGVGSLVPNTYYWVVTAVGNGGETVKSNEQSIVAVDPLSKFSIDWAAVPKATSYKIYRSAVAGTYGPASLVGVTAGLNFIDTGQALQSGTPPLVAFVPAAAPNCQNAVGVTNDAVEGTDVTIPIFKFTYNYYPSDLLMTPDYIIQLMKMGGTTNVADWKGFAPGEVLCLGVSGQPRGSDDWELGMHFIGSPNVENLTVGEIENIIKGGHHYLWVTFADSVAANKAIKVPQFAYVERMYEPANFSLLGIGV